MILLCVFAALRELLKRKSRKIAKIGLKKE